MERRAKILATLGPSSADARTIRSLIEAGADGFRVNLSHGAAQWHRDTVACVRRVADETGRPVGILFDLAGPKVRTGTLRDGGPVTLETGADVRIEAAPVVGDARRFSSTLGEAITSIPEGSRILIDDGAIELRAAAREHEALVCRVVDGGPLGEHKGINVPGVRLPVPALTPKDRSDIQLGREVETDLFALSFVRSPEDLREARTLIEATGRPVPLVAKIEKSEAIAKLDEVIAQADGVLVARGDLGVEMGPEEVPVLQKDIIARANAAGKFVITATQMLQSMVKNLRPTRAEASDVANAVFDGSDALLLTGETAIGAHPVEVVRTMDRIVRRAEDSPHVPTRLDRSTLEAGGSYRRALAEAAAYAAREMRLRSIVVFTVSGTMARHVAALRPAQRILALTPSPLVCRQLSYVWGVDPYPLPFEPTSDALLQRCREFLVERGLASPGEEVIAMAGRISEVGISRAMKILRV